MATARAEANAAKEELGKSRAQVAALTDELANANAKLVEIGKKGKYPEAKVVPEHASAVTLPVDGELPRPGTIVDLVVEPEGKAKDAFIFPNVVVVTADPMPPAKHSLFMLTHGQVNLIRPFLGKGLVCRIMPPGHYDAKD